MISSRQAAARLGEVGVTRRQTNELLDAGLAGPALTDDLVDAACPWGLFVARQRLDTWAFSPMTSVWIWSRIGRHGHLPFVSTICGFVTDGAEITRTIPVSGGGYQLQLREPGPWSDALREHRLLSGRGRPWVLRENRHGKLVT